MVPEGSTATPRMYDRFALVAGPPSPLKPGVVPPATVTTLPWLIRRTREPSSKYTADELSTATTVALVILADVAGMFSPVPLPPPAKVLMLPSGVTTRMRDEESTI